MAKLKCAEHNRRIVIFRHEAEGNLVTVHRTGDGSSCRSDKLVIGDNEYILFTYLHLLTSSGRCIHCGRYPYSYMSCNPYDKRVYYCSARQARQPHVVL